MDFALSEEQRELKALAHQILGDQTENEHLREIEKQEDRFDARLWSDLATAGLLGVALAEDRGGMALGFDSLCLLVEEVGMTVAPVPVIPTLVSGALAIDRFGSEQQRERWLPGVARGDVLLSAGLIEFGNEVVGAPRCEAERTASGYRVSGAKSCVPFAGRAARILIGARLEDGVAVFLLDPRAPGVTLTRQRCTAGEPQFAVDCRDVEIDSADLLAGPEDGRAVLRYVEERTIAANCAMAVGVCERAMRMTAAYTAQREQFGVKIATFQAVGQRAASCYIDVACLRLVTDQAVSLLAAEREAAAELAIAKVWAGDVAHRVSHAAQHLHGGIGVDRDYPLFRYCLWAKQLELAFGSSAAMLARIGEEIAAEFRA